MLSRRIQLLLDQERYERLASEAHARGVSVASLIRKAIDRTFPPQSQRRAEAAKRILTAPTMRVPDPDELRHELDEIRDRTS
jgi:hypothetical protein